MAWDLMYKNGPSPALANQNAPTTDGGADDPDGATFSASGLGAFDVPDKFADGAAGLMLFADGGAVTDITIYVYSKAAGKWLLLAAGLAPAPATGPARVQLPSYSRCFIRVVNKGTATAIYGALEAYVPN